MQPQAPQTFFRSSDRTIGGVCSGLAEGFHVETLWVRLAFVLLAFAQGVGILLYIVLWVLMPERVVARPAGRNALDSMTADFKRAWDSLRWQPRAPVASPAPAPTSTVSASTPAPVPSAPAPEPPGPISPAPVPVRPAASNPTLFLGVVLVGAGLAFLATNTGLVSWNNVWPAGLIVLGVALLPRSIGRSG